MINFPKKIMVHAYKFNGDLYKTIEFPRVIYNDDEMIVLSLEKTWVISEKNKRHKFYHSFSDNDSFMVFIKDKWYNFFVNINVNNDTIIYYFNVATPFIYEEQAIKYIDLDLDVRCTTINGILTNLKMLDYNEFISHSQEMLYPKKLINHSIKINELIVDLIKKDKIYEKFNKDFFIEMYKKLKGLNNGK